MTRNGAIDLERSRRLVVATATLSRLHSVAWSAWRRSSQVVEFSDLTVHQAEPGVPEPFGLIGCTYLLTACTISEAGSAPAK